MRNVADSEIQVEIVTRNVADSRYKLKLLRAMLQIVDTS